jgi:predicted amidohydrolase YtcJ
VRISIGVLVLLLGLTACSAETEPAPDLVLANGKVFTADAAAPWAEAVAIRGSRILAVGSDAEVRALAGAGTRVVELDGRVVIPGLNDAHRHFELPVSGSHQLALTPLEPSWDELEAALRQAAATTPAGTWIEGTIGVTVMTDPHVDRERLDGLAPEHPVRLATFYGHGDIYNSLALSELGVEESEADPLGGFWERASVSGRLNGRVFEYPQWNARRRLNQEIEMAVVVERLRAEAAEMLAVGITSAQTMPMLSLHRFVDGLIEAGLPIRVRAIRFPGTEGQARLLDEDRDVSVPTRLVDRITVGGTKWILDGTPLERGAAMRQPYHDAPEQRGRLNFPAEEVAAMLRESIVADEQLLVHAVGDHALGVLLSAMESMPEVDWPPRRVRVEHGDALFPDLAERAAQLGVVVVQNPTHFALPAVVQRVGTDRGFQPLRSLLDAGIPLALGSDGPPNPWLDVMLATLHPASPSEAVTVEQAIVAYTRGAAFAELEEEEKGTLVAGKLADLAVLSQDVFMVPADALPSTRSVLTLLGGKIVHDAGELR